MNELTLASVGILAGKLVIQKVDGQGSHLSFRMLIAEPSPTCHLCPCWTIFVRLNMLLHVYEDLLPKSMRRKSLLGKYLDFKAL